jgi:hypothetical protein
MAVDLADTVLRDGLEQFFLNCEEIYSNSTFVSKAESGSRMGGNWSRNNRALAHTTTAAVKHVGNRNNGRHL